MPCVCAKRRDSTSLHQRHRQQARQVEVQAALDLDLVARVMRPKLKPGLGSRPACTRSASPMPSSWNAACSPRLLSSATCTASSTASGWASSSPHALVDQLSWSAVGAGPAHVLAQPLLGGLLDGGEAAVGAERGTAGEHGSRGAAGPGPHGAWPNHRRLPGRCRCIAMVFMASCGHRALAAWAWAGGVGGCGGLARSARRWQLARAAAPRGRRRASRRCARRCRWPRARGSPFRLQHAGSG